MHSGGVRSHSRVSQSDMSGSWVEGRRDVTHGGPVGVSSAGLVWCVGVGVAVEGEQWYTGAVLVAQNDGATGRGGDGLTQASPITTTAVPQRTDASFAWVLVPWWPRPDAGSSVEGDGCRV